MVLQFTAITTLFLACVVYMLGVYLVRKVNFLQRFFIPEPVVGGLIVAIVSYAEETVEINLVN